MGITEKQVQDKIDSINIRLGDCFAGSNNSQVPVRVTLDTTYDYRVIFEAHTETSYGSTFGNAYSIDRGKRIPVDYSGTLKECYSFLVGLHTGLLNS